MKWKIIILILGVVLILIVGGLIFMDKEDISKLIKPLKKEGIIKRAVIWSDELMVNGGFEWGNFTGWTISGETAGWAVGTNPTSGSAGPQAGSYCVYANGASHDFMWSTEDPNGSYYVRQDVNVTSYASYIDTGQAVLNFSGWGVSSEATYDYTEIKVYFLFENLTTISQPLNAGNLSNNDNWWKVNLTNYEIPENTRYVRVLGNTYEQFYDSGSLDSFSVMVGYEGAPPVYDINITNPTTSNPLSVTEGNNYSIYFNFTQDSSYITSGVNMDSVFIGGVNSSIVKTINELNTLYLRTNDNGAADYNETVTFLGMPNTSYVALANQLPNADVAYSMKFLSKEVTSTQWWIQNDGGGELATNFMWGVFSTGHYVSGSNHIDCGIDTDTGSTNAVTFSQEFPDAMYAAICNPGTDVDSPICVVNEGVAKSTTGLSFYLSDDGGAAETTTGGINYCAFSYGEYDVGEVGIKSNNMSVTNGIVSVNFDTNFTTDYVVFITEISPTTDDGCAFLVTGRTAGGFTAIGYDDANASSTCDQPINWVAIEKGEFNETMTQEETQFAYIPNVGWQVNVTAPTGFSGLQDLFLNATYSGNLRNDTQSNAINYSGGEEPEQCWNYDSGNKMLIIPNGCLYEAGDSGI